MTRKPNTCGICRAASGTAMLCRSCTRRLTEALGDVNFLEQELNISRARQRRYTATGDKVTRKGNSQPLPFDARAGDTLAAMRAALTFWARAALDAKATDKQPTRDTCAAYAAVLLNCTSWLRYHGDAARAYRDLVDAVTRARHVIDTPAIRSTFPVGPCPIVEVLDQGDGLITTSTCPGTVKAWIPASEAETPHLECNTCGETWPSWTWRRVGRAIIRRRRELAREDARP